MFISYFAGPLGAITNLATPQATTHPPATSEANSAATSRTASKENLCEECIQNPLDLIDASIQVLHLLLCFTCRCHDIYLHCPVFL